MGSHFVVELKTIADGLNKDVNALKYRDLFTPVGKCFPLFDEFIKEYCLLKKLYLEYPKDILVCITEQYINLKTKEYNFDIGTKAFFRLVPKTISCDVFTKACYEENIDVYMLTSRCVRLVFENFHENTPKNFIGGERIINKFVSIFNRCNLNVCCDMICHENIFGNFVLIYKKRSVD